MAREIDPEKALTAAAIDKLAKGQKLPNRFAIIKRFGSLQAFQEACGFEGRIQTKRWPGVTNDELISIARELSPDAALSASRMSALSAKGLFLAAGAIRKRFGGLAEFQIACGFEPLKKAKG